MLRKWIGPLFGTALLLSGCISAGQPFLTTGIENIVVGQTTKKEIRQQYGEPWRTGLDNGQRTWSYGQYTYSLFAPARTRDLVIRFSSDDTVASYSFNSNFPEDRAR